MTLGRQSVVFNAVFPNRRGPNLLFNGACGSEDYFEAATAGDDMSLIADLGANTLLEDISASRAFNVQRVHSFPAYSKFAKAVKVEANHTYAVLLNEMYKRGLVCVHGRGVRAEQEGQMLLPGGG